MSGRTAIRLWCPPKDVIIIPLRPVFLFFPFFRLRFPYDFPYLSSNITTPVNPWYSETHDGIKFFVKRYCIRLPSGYSFLFNVGIPYTNPEAYQAFYDEETGNVRLTLKELFTFVQFSLDAYPQLSDPIENDILIEERLKEFKKMIIHSLINKIFYPLPSSPPSLPFQITSPCA